MAGGGGVVSVIAVGAILNSPGEELKEVRNVRELVGVVDLKVMWISLI